MPFGSKTLVDLKHKKYLIEGSRMCRWAGSAVVWSRKLGGTASGGWHFKVIIPHSPTYQPGDLEQMT